VRLIADDYAVLKKYRGLSSFESYLSGVAAKFAIDHFRKQWGRFRYSAKASSIGPEAEELEQLVYRDGFGLEEAMEAVRTYHPEWSRQYLQDVWNQLPQRKKPTEVSEEAAAGVAAQETAESSVELGDLRRRVQGLEARLQAALAALPDRSRIMLALRFEGRQPVSRIATIVGLPAPTAQRQIEVALRQLAATLRESGVKPGDLLLLGHASVTLSPLLRRELDFLLGPVRLFKRDG
jgi:RNA polymerase sigma factor (sigma-70 family)